MERSIILKVPDTEDFEEVKKFISNYVLEKTGIKHPPSTILVESADDSNAFKIILQKYENSPNKIEDFESKTYFGSIYEVADSEAYNEKRLLIIVKKGFFYINL